MEGTTGTTEAQGAPSSTVSPAEAARRAHEQSTAADPDRKRKAETPIGKAAAGRPLADSETIDAMEWLLSDEADEEPEVPHKVLNLNLGSDEQPRWTKWTIRALDGDTIMAVRRRASGQNRAQRRAQTAGVLADDPMRENVGLVVAATVEPDLREAARVKADASGHIVSPEDILRHRFRYKSGLLGQIAGWVMDLSGYDEGDVKAAAGN